MFSIEKITNNFLAIYMRELNLLDKVRKVLWEIFSTNGTNSISLVFPTKSPCLFPWESFLEKTEYRPSIYSSLARALRYIFLTVVSKF